MSEIDSVVKEFLVESHENLDSVEQHLLDLERDPSQTGHLASIFRAVHTVKGTCGFLGFSKLEAIAHVGENLLSRLRDGDLAPSSEIVDALLRLTDAIRAILAEIERTGAEGEKDYPELLEQLEAVQRDGGEETGETAAPGPDASEAPAQPSDAEAPSERAPAAQAPADQAPAAPAPAAPAPAAPAPVMPDQPAREGADAHDGDDDHEAETGGRTRGASDGTIRVHVSLLDTLMNLVGELVLTRNQILQLGTGGDASAHQATYQRLNLITSELQEGVMKTRMQPIKNVWNRFPRVVRDLSASCGKQVRMEMEGAETELDKTLIEAVKDPLTHLVRNAVDHGIEPPEDRVARGKPAEGCLTLRSFHEGGHVNIEIADDGRGIDPERIREKARNRGLVSAEKLTQMSPREILNLIFLPGFSTAEQVTNISGRGVGMDVVKSNLERLGGSVDLHSEPGRGTTVKIKIPLTLAIVPALIVTAGGERFAIPQISLLELVRIEGEAARKAIEEVQGAPVLRLRGNLLPLVRLGDELELEPAHGAGQADEAVNVVVLLADNRSFGLIVDDVNDTEEIVVKPLGNQFKDVRVFAGATIMGDGRVALILDVLGLAQRVGVAAESSRHGRLELSAPSGNRAADKHTLLVVATSDGRHHAVPLNRVSRLEEIPPSRIERAGDQEVVQHRSRILPLVRLEHVVGGQPTADADREALPVVVFAQDGRDAGLVVERIVDIVETELTVHPRNGRPGLLGSAVVQGRVTDLLDPDGVLGAAGIDLYDAPVAAAAGA